MKKRKKTVIIIIIYRLWNRFYRCFLLFCLYFTISLACFTMRPTPPIHVHDEVTTPSYTTTDATPSWSPSTYSSEIPPSTTYWPPGNETIDPSLYDSMNETVGEPTLASTVWERPSTSPATQPVTSPSPSPSSSGHGHSHRHRDRDDDDDDGYSCDLQQVIGFLTDEIFKIIT